MNSGEEKPCGRDNKGYPLKRIGAVERDERERIERRTNMLVKKGRRSGGARGLKERCGNVGKW